MAAWAGFTDDDLKKMKGEVPARQGPLGTIRKADPSAPTSSQHGKPPLKRLHPKTSQPTAPVPQAALLSQPKQLPRKMQYLPDENDPQVQAALKPSRDPTGPGESHANASSPKKDLMPAADAPAVEPKPPDDGEDLLLDEEEILSREIGNIEKFRENQKKIEEMNKRKKMALYDAIQQRQKQAKMEERKLAAIHKELRALDQMVNADVSVIRDKIEDASRDYLEAQKRYDCVEKEFIEAKIDLHKKEELKEQLTDHLYAIIHQNEVRKARKLAELMHKLNMEDGQSAEEDSVVGETEHMELPPITLFHPVHVAKGPKTPEASKEPSPEKPSEKSLPADDKQEVVPNGTTSPPEDGPTDKPEKGDAKVTEAAAPHGSETESKETSSSADVGKTGAS